MAARRRLPGLAPVSASDNSRNVLGTYVDLSTHLTPKWTVDLAGRFEHYSDVGSTTNGKFSTRYDFTPVFAVRGSVSTGFRAPSLAEEYYSNMNESPASVYRPSRGQLGGGQVDRRAAAAVGEVDQLQPRLRADPGARDLHLTLDAYQIDIRNRIVEGGTASGAAAIAAMEAAGLSVPSSIPASAVSASYFTNGASTRTRGIDLPVPTTRALALRPGGLGSGREHQHYLGHACGDRRERCCRNSMRSRSAGSEHLDAKEQDHHWRYVASRQVGREPARDTLWHYVE